MAEFASNVPVEVIVIERLDKIPTANWQTY